MWRKSTTDIKLLSTIIIVYFRHFVLTMAASLMDTQMTNTSTSWPPTEYPDNTIERPFVPTLRDRTYNALRDTIDKKQKTIREIAAGADLEYGWLRIFAANDIPDPAVSRIERLHNYLIGVKL